MKNLAVAAVLATSVALPLGATEAPEGSAEYWQQQAEYYEGKNAKNHAEKQKYRAWWLQRKYEAIAKGKQIVSLTAELDGIEDRIQEAKAQAYVHFDDVYTWNAPQSSSSQKENSFNVKVDYDKNGTGNWATDEHVDWTIISGEDFSFKAGLGFNITKGNRSAFENAVDNIAFKTYNEGYSDGYSDGYEKGWNEGWDAAINYVEGD